MQARRFSLSAVALVVALGTANGATVAESQPQWEKPTAVVATSLTMEVCVEPPMLREKTTHDALFHTLGDLGGDYAHLEFWYPYPKLSVAELQPPTADKVS